MDTLKVKAVLSNLTKGGSPCYQLFPKDAKPMSQEEFVRLFADAIGRSPAEARFINDVHGQVFCKGIVQNRVVNTGSLRGYLVATGSLATAGERIDPVKNPVKAVIVANGELRDCVNGVLAVNDTQVVEAVLYTVQYGTSESLNTIEGTGLTKANGSGIRITPENADEGIWLESGAGEMVTDKAAIALNDENLLNFSFATLPEDGRYRLVIATRNGQSKDDYGVVRLERLVNVITH